MVRGWVGEHTTSEMTSVKRRSGFLTFEQGGENGIFFVGDGGGGDGRHEGCHDGEGGGCELHF